LAKKQFNPNSLKIFLEAADALFHPAGKKGTGYMKRVLE